MRRNGFRNRVTLTFDLLTSGSVHARRVLYNIRVPSLVLIAEAIFLLERGQTDIQMRLNDLLTPAATAISIMLNIRLLVERKRGYAAICNMNSIHHNT